MENQELWQSVLSEIQLSISEANFSTWFKDTKIIDSDESRVIIAVPNLFVKEWLEKKYNSLINQSLYNISKKNQRIDYVIGAVAKKGVGQKSSGNVSQKQMVLSSVDPITNLNSKYQFNNFVVGSHNELAYAASMAITKNNTIDSNIRYNPLLIYGDTGLGKTHLLQAIGNEFLKNSKKGVRYLSSEKFASELVDSIKFQKIQDLKERYKKIDLLILDDIQFLSKKEKTQEELFHIFNDLHNNNKQIVLSSDRLPKAIPSLEKRLLSRFEGGVMVDIGCPDYETRIAILESKLSEYKIELPKNVIDYLASNIQENIRELEGALNKLIVTQNLNNQKIDLNLAKKLLNKTISTTPKKNVDINKIIKNISDFYNLKKEDLLSQSKKKEMARPRQIAMYLLKKESQMSYASIAQKLNRKDHTTVIYAFKQISQKIEESDEFKREIDLIRQRIYD